MDFWRGDDGPARRALPEQRLRSSGCRHEQPFGPDFQHAGGVAHGLERRLQNINAIDFGRPDDAKPPSQRHGPDLGGQTVPAGRRQHLGVRKAGNNRAFRAKSPPPQPRDRQGSPARLHRSRQPPKRVCRGTSRPASRKGTEAALPARIRIFCGQPYTLRNKRPKREKGIFAGKIPFSRTPVAGRETPHCGEKLPSSLMGN